jgi:hypothetical protein
MWSDSPKVRAVVALRKNLQWALVRMTREALSYILRETDINTLTEGRGHRGLELPVN